MAISISSCLKPSPPPTPSPPPSPSPLLNRTTFLTPWSASKEASWRSRCVATAAACIIIGSTAGSGGAVLAGDDLPVMDGSRAKVVVARWSDKRKCPPWRVNSLENIVPEDLPRPSPGRRSDGLVTHKYAPKVGGVSIQYKSGCYSL